MLPFICKVKSLCCSLKTYIYVVGYLLIGCLKCDRSDTISNCKTNYSDIFVIFLCKATEKNKVKFECFIIGFE